jgi:hypothetical protein
MSDDTKKQVKSESWLLVIFMIIVGGVSIALGIVNYALEYDLISGASISWWPFTGPGTAAFTAAVSLPIGVWMFIGGIGIAKEKDWSLGVAFVCFTVILANIAVGTIQLVYDATIDHLAWYTQWGVWVSVILVAFSAIGFIYLLATHKRFH